MRLKGGHLMSIPDVVSDTPYGSIGTSLQDVLTITKVLELRPGGRSSLSLPRLNQDPTKAASVSACGPDQDLRNHTRCSSFQHTNGLNSRLNAYCQAQLKFTTIHARCFLSVYEIAFIAYLGCH
ncbi:hypothetical protein J3459_014921 [Metarhizium acridum]|nr:hypothetical protein J3459_014921 [Metarhizium acridum]